MAEFVECFRKYINKTVGKYMYLNHLAIVFEDLTENKSHHEISFNCVFDIHGAIGFSGSQISLN